MFKYQINCYTTTEFGKKCPKKKTPLEHTLHVSSFQPRPCDFLLALVILLPPDRPHLQEGSFGDLRRKFPHPVQVVLVIPGSEMLFSSALKVPQIFQRQICLVRLEREEIRAYGPLLALGGFGYQQNREKIVFVYLSKLFHAFFMRTKFYVICLKLNVCF